MRELQWVVVLDGIGDDEHDWVHLASFYLLPSQATLGTAKTILTFHECIYRERLRRCGGGEQCIQIESGLQNRLAPRQNPGRVNDKPKLGPKIKWTLYLNPNSI